MLELLVQYSTMQFILVQNPRLSGRKGCSLHQWRRRATLSNLDQVKGGGSGPARHREALCLPLVDSVSYVQHTGTAQCLPQRAAFSSAEARVT